MGRLSDGNPRTVLNPPVSSSLLPQTPLIDYSIQTVVVVVGRCLWTAKTQNSKRPLAFPCPPWPHCCESLGRSARGSGSPRVPHAAVKCGQVISSCRHTINSRVCALLARGENLTQTQVSSRAPRRDFCGRDRRKKAPHFHTRTPAFKTVF